MKPMFALHKNAEGDVLAAASFNYEHDKAAWLRNLDVRPGDTIEFKAAAHRPEFDEAPVPPAFIEAAPSPVPALAGDDQPF